MSTSSSVSNPNPENAKPGPSFRDEGADLDRVRDLLFGKQLREMEEGMRALEERLQGILGLVQDEKVSRQDLANLMSDVAERLRGAAPSSGRFGASIKSLSDSHTRSAR